MLNILKNFDAVSSGKKQVAGQEEKESMRTILESFKKVAVEECGDMMPMQSSSPAGSPVTVNITASGKDNVEELMALLRNAGMGQQEPQPTGPSQDMDMAAMRAAIMGPKEESVEEDDRYQASTSPDEDYQDHEYMTKDLSGGINRQKKMFKPAAKGDNPMAVESIKQRLMQALAEKKAVEGKYANDEQRKAIHASKSKKKK